jgi:hypothetical protein
MENETLLKLFQELWGGKADGEWWRSEFKYDML